MGPASLAVTGRLADGWSPAGAQDWLSDSVRSDCRLIDEARSLWAHEIVPAVRAATSRSS